MNILIYGHRGYLGSYLFNELSKNHNIYRANGKDYDINFDLIINCAGYPQLINSSEDIEKCINSNLKYSEQIAHKHQNTKIIYFSSYYVYYQKGLCSETSRTTIKYCYTRCKLEMEKLLKPIDICFRLGKLFGKSEIRQYKFTEYVLDPNLKVCAADRVLFNPTSLKQVKRIIDFEIETGLLNGIYNLSNKEICSHYEFAKILIDKFKINKQIEVIDNLRYYKHYGRFAMDTTKLEKYVILTPWWEDLDELCSVSLT